MASVMSSASRRTSAFTQNATFGDRRNLHRRKVSDEPKKEIWSTLLDGVSSGKRLPEKNLLVLGGTTETQRDFLEALSTGSSRRRPPDRSKSRNPPIANQFALGYTYQDVLDADHDDTLARLSLYLLTEPSPSFTPLLKPLLNPRTLRQMLIVILLDWSQPWFWIRQLRQWMRVLRALMISLDDESKDILEENIIEWRDRRRTTGGEGASSVAADANIKLPLGPGEWDEPLGVPLCVVCQNADKIEGLERERGWREEEFDFILQYIRTVLLKHGASLIYTMPDAPGSLQTLIHSSLGIQSMLERRQIQHNIIDRDSILIPPNWDSWGKIRIMREGFDVEGVSKLWSVDIQTLPGELTSVGRTNGHTTDQENTDEGFAEEEAANAVSVYEEVIRDPAKQYVHIPGFHSGKTPRIEIEALDNQDFLAGQLEILERLRADDEREKASRETKKAASGFISLSADASGVVEEHIGPVQFNMGGIQVDADDMLKRLKRREADRSSDSDTTSGAALPDNKSENEVLASFFAGLMKRGGGGSSATNSPRAPSKQ